MLEHVAISGFRCCDGTDLSFEQGLTCLVGRNGAGKTTLLRGIQRIADLAVGKPAIEDRAEVRLMAEAALNAVLHVVLGTQRYEYKVSRGRRGIEESLRVSGLSDQGTNAQDVFVRVGRELLLSSNRTVEVPSEGPTGLILPTVLPSTDAEWKLIRPFFAFLGRVGYYTLRPMVDRRLGPIAAAEYQQWLQRYEVDGEPPESVLTRLIYLFEKQKHTFEELRQLMGPKRGLGLLDDIRILKVQSGASATSNISSSYYFVLFTPADGLGGAKNQMDFHSLSDGTKNLLRILVSLAFDNRSVALIEEPEESIHSDLLHKLAGILRSYAQTAQIVFSTHSLEFLDLLEPNEVRFVYVEGANTRTRPLSAAQIQSAREYMRGVGRLSGYLQVIDPGERS